MRSKRFIGPAGTAWTAVMAVGVATVVLTVIARRPLSSAGESDLALGVMGVAAGALFASIALLILVRGRNVTGWFLMASGACLVLEVFSGAYPAVGVVAHPGSLPAPEVVSAALQPMLGASLASLGLMLLVFPVGSPPSPRWRPVLWLGIAGIVATYVGLMVKPRSINPFGAFRFANPIGIATAGPLISTVLVGTAWVTVLAAGAGFAGLVVRFRRGSPELRQQIKWLSFVAGAAGVCLVTALAGLVACGCDQSAVADFALLAFFAILVLGVPAAMAIAILKYRLYEIDVIISRTVLYGLLAAFFTAVYLALVIGLGTAVGKRGNSFLTVVAAVLIAVAFQPVRERARRLANRMVYGKRASPYEVLSAFSERMAGTYALDDVLPRMARILGEGTGARRTEIWLRVGDELRPEARWPPGDDPSTPVPASNGALPDFPGVDRASPVRHQGELLGVLTLTKSPAEPVTPAEDKLLTDLASQAGLVLRNAGLTAELQANLVELRASRQRLVAAQDEERRRLERNLHDGAQQQLVAIAIRQRLAQQLVPRDPEKAVEMLSELQEDTAGAIENLRDLARGIFPPLLADQGLAAALEAQARKVPLPISVEARGLARFAQAQEACAYFCILEALQNVTKYAGATAVTVRLWEKEGRLAFSVSDDGAGFDPQQTSYGTGLQGMADRLAVLDGTLEVRSAPGEGTTVIGSLPVTPAAG